MTMFGRPRVRSGGRIGADEAARINRTAMADAVALPAGVDGPRDLSKDEAAVLRFVAGHAPLHAGEAADSLGSWRDPDVIARAKAATKRLVHRGLLTQDRSERFVLTRPEGQNLAAVLLELERK